MANRSDLAPLAGFPYIVRVHEHVDAEVARVVLKCLGYPTKGTQPVGWEYVLQVPKTELSKWPLGANVRLAVTA